MTNLRVVRAGPSREQAGDYAYEEIQFRSSSPREYEDNVFSKLVSNAVIHALEALLTALLSPIMMWQWLLKHDHFMIILKVIIEVVLELLMLIVFAGVSILTAAALIFDDAYNKPTETLKTSSQSKYNFGNKKISSSQLQAKLLHRKRNFPPMIK